MIALVFKFEMQINDNAQYCGKKAPHGKKGDGVEPVSHHKKQQRQNAINIDYFVTRKEGSNTCCRKIELQHRMLLNIWYNIHNVSINFGSDRKSDDEVKKVQ